MLTKTDQNIRPVEEKDRNHVGKIIHFGSLVHRHLDWRFPLDWIGFPPFYVFEQNNTITAALACPPDLPDVAWIQLFACDTKQVCRPAWENMWAPCRDYLVKNGIKFVAAIPLHKWFQEMLKRESFQNIHNVIVFAWDNQLSKQPEPKPFHIRDFKPDELDTIQEIDKAAFGPIWRNSLKTLKLAYKQAKYATVVEDEIGPFGYQISTPRRDGVHLARLAIHPRNQNKGAGYALLHHLQTTINDTRQAPLTVNTQDNNQASIGLYKKGGFIQTIESYPVYLLEIN